MSTKPYRKEIKRLLTPAQALLLEQRIASVLSTDIHSRSDGAYTIRSIYFDTLTDKAYSEKEAGISEREKIRIRFYNYKDGVIKLERKEKKRDLISKESLTISKQTVTEMLNGDYQSLPSYNHPLADYIYSLAHSEGLRPVVVVDYTRKAYVYPISNVRITFDSALQAGRTDIPIWEDSGTFDVLQGNTILEIKYDEYLPEHLRQLLCSVSGERIALSKYTLCRQNLLYKQGDYLGGKR